MTRRRSALATQLSTQLLFTLGAIAILGPFGTDVYLPAFPQMADSLNTSAAGIQLTLTAFTVGMAFGQLTMGSLSDRIGRKPLIVFGCLIMCAASGLASIAQDLVFLLICCLFIGIAASAGMVCGRAMVSDLATGNEAAKGFSVLGIMAGIGPIIGPVGGALIMQLTDWRGIFASLAILALAFSTLAFFGLQETLSHAGRHSGGFKSVFATMGKVTSNRNFLFHALILWAGFGMMFAYISASPFVLQNVFGLSPLLYTLDFGANGLALMLTGFLSASLVAKITPTSQVRIGIAMQLLAATLLAFTLISSQVPLWAVLLAFALIPASMGFVFGPVTALALSQVRHAAGTALAIMGAVQFVLAGVAAFVVGLGGATDLKPLSWTLGVLAAIALLAISLIPKSAK